MQDECSGITVLQSMKLSAEKLLEDILLGVNKATSDCIHNPKVHYDLLSKYQNTLLLFLS